MRIIVTGTPGTGKTVISKKLAKNINLKYVDVDKVIKEHGDVVEGFDNKHKCRTVNERKLARILEKYDGVIDSHLSHYMSASKVDVCIVLRCSPKELIKRLKRREYSKSKIEENVEAEIMNVCGDDAFREGHRIVEINTTNKEPDEVVKEIIEKIK